MTRTATGHFQIRDRLLRWRERPNIEDPARNPSVSAEAILNTNTDDAVQLFLHQLIADHHAEVAMATAEASGGQDDMAVDISQNVLTARPTDPRDPPGPPTYQELLFELVNVRFCESPARQVVSCA